jgi:hypothetical protein
MPLWNSEWLKFTVKIELSLFLKAMLFFHPMDRVYICFDLTDSKMISATMCVRKTEFSQGLRRFGAYYEVRDVCPYVFPD